MTFTWTTLRVSNLDRSLHFYHDLLGLPIAERFGPPVHEIAMLGEGDGTKLELLCDAGTMPENVGLGLSMGFAPDDFDACIAKLRANGLTVSPPVSPNPNLTFCFVSDPDGYMVQIVSQHD